MEYNYEKIRELLKEYYSLKARSELMKKISPFHTKTKEFYVLSQCLGVLQVDDRALVEAVLIEKVGLRKYGKVIHLSHTTVMRRLEKIVRMLTEIFNEYLSELLG